MNRSDEVVNEYRGFLLDVCTAYNYHTKFAIEQLVSSFSFGKHINYFIKINHVWYFILNLICS